MGLFDAVRKTFNKPSPVHHARESDEAEARPEEPAPIVVPEIQPADLIPVYEAGNAPRLLDCREPYEWNQVRIPGSLHIPMNQIPGRLGELDPADEWIVVCAHGNRSFSVAGYLIHNGYRASSLAGGVTDWWMRGGKTESGARR
ncbi:MAG: rhodanese-like domain-containing protein [Caldilineales bacterium]